MSVVTNSAINIYDNEVILKYDPTYEEQGELFKRDISLLTSEDGDRIIPLSVRAMMKFLSSDFFFPSEYPLRKISDKGSIKRSLEAADINLLDRGEKLRGRFHIQRIGCAFARSIAFMLIAGLVALLGFIYHSSSLLLGYSFKWLKGDEDQDALVKKIKGHADIAIGEFAVALFLNYNPILYIFSDWFEIAPIIPLVCSVILYLEFALIFELCIFEQVAQSPGYAKALALKHDLGIVSEKGGLLTWDIEEDSELVLTANPTESKVRNSFTLHGQITNLYISKGKELLELIGTLRLLYGERAKELLQYPFTSLEFFENQQDNYLKDDLAYWKSAFTRIQDEMLQAKSLLKRFTYVSLVDFPFSKEESDKLLLEYESEYESSCGQEEILLKA